ncbi:MAG: cell division ATP-binding protein FtsE [Nitrospirae bacterium]|nr:MAG: cell division ATP-binding protein FtsE [Nitrospirota bacterium]
MIEIFHVSKTYNGRVALDDVSLKVDKGEFIFLTGRSGAGKTTLLRLIFRAEVPDEGQIVVNDRNLAHIAESRVPYLRRTMGFIFQDFRLLQKKTVFDNVAITLKVVGMPEGLMRPKVMNALRLVGLDQRQGALPSTLSAGEQQRLCLARAIVNDPQVLLADEPTSNLDAQLSAEIFDLLKVVNLRGTTVVVATHSADMVSYLRRRVVTLEDGRVMANGTAEA